MPIYRVLSRTQKILLTWNISKRALITESSSSVHAQNSRRAFDVLALLAPEEEGPDAEPDDAIEYAVLCPKCHSQEVLLRDDGPEAAAADAEGKFKWQCDACGHQWENEGIEEKL